MIAVGQGLVPTPPAAVETPGEGTGEGTAPGEFTPVIAPRGGVTVLGLVATVGVVVGLQGWFDNPPDPLKGLVVPVALPDGD
jgi:hypothetical protein